MKKLKIKSLYKILLLLIINIYINNIFIFILSICLLIFLEKGKSLIISIIFICLVFISNNHFDYINYGFVDKVSEKYIIVNKILYKTKVYNTDFVVGDIVYTNGYKSIENDSDLKNNIIFINEKCAGIGVNNFKKSIYKYINNLDSSNIYKNIFYNVYSEDIYQEYNNISFSLSFYYFVYLIYRKNKNIGIILVIIYSILFGFQIKFYLIIISFLLSFIDLDRTEKNLFKILIICVINKYLLLNYLFILGIIISCYSLSSRKINPIFIGLLQSFFFGEIKIFNVLFYKLYLFEKITVFIFALLSLLICPLQDGFILYSHLLDKIFSIFSLSIRGSINIPALFILLLFFKIFKIKNNLIKYFMFIFIALIPFNMFITHINFIDVGQGDSALIIDSSCNKTILIDTGSKYTYSKLKKELYREGIYRINYLIITHDDEDHNGNINNLSNDFIIDNYIYDGEDIYTNNLSLNYLSLGNNNGIDNDNSLVYLLYIDNYSVLFTGDISSNVENKIITDFSINDIDILKVSHHGSNSASSRYFIGSLKPEIAIISTSGQYGHPHKEVIKNLNDFLVKTYITKNDGSIKIFFTNLIDYIITGKNRFDIIKK